MKLSQMNSTSIMKSVPLLSVSTLLSGGINYLFQIVLGKNLDVSQFGKISSILAYLNFVGLFTYSVRMFTVSVYLKPDIESVVSSNVKYEFKVIKLGVVIVLLLLAAAVVLGLNGYSDSHALMIAGLWLLPSTLVMVGIGKLQAAQRFKEIAFLSVLLAIVKIFSVVLALRYSNNAEVIALALLPGFILVSFIALRKEKELVQITINPRFKDYLLTTITYLLMAFFINADIIIVRLSQSDQLAGIYAASSLIAKIVFLLASGIAEVVYPRLVTESLEKLQRKKEFLKLVKYQMMFASALAVLLGVAGNRLVEFTLGRDYLGNAGLVLSIAVGSVGAALLFLIVHKEVADSNWRIIPCLAVAITMSYILIYMTEFNDQLIGPILGANAVLCALFVLSLDLFGDKRSEDQISY